MSNSSYNDSSADSSTGASPRFISVRISRENWELQGEIVAEIKTNGIVVRTQRKSQEPPKTPRGPIKGFSKDAQKRLLQFMLTVDIASVAQPTKKAPQGKAFFFSLTYRKQNVPNYERKRHLDLFLKRLEYAYGKLGVIWKLEYQERGTPHYHLMLFFEQLMQWQEVRDWCFSAWRAVTGDDCYPDVVTVYIEKGNVGRLINYTIKYLAKGFEADLPTGRVWGCWNKSKIPVADSYMVDLTYQDYVEYLRRIRRIYQDDRFLGSKIANYGGVTVFGDQRKTVQQLRGLGEYRVFDPEE